VALSEVTRLQAGRSAGLDQALARTSVD
jgi:hypothetical protein